MTVNIVQISESIHSSMVTKIHIEKLYNGQCKVIGVCFMIHLMSKLIDSIGVNANTNYMYNLCENYLNLSHQM